jgi:glycosyltransferase involved in cell wall biosynthesis
LSGSREPEITAIICTHNRADLLEKCIRSVLDQTLERRRYELIVVDNASTDETPAVCERFSGEPSVRIVREPVPGLSRARNTGWREARGSYVGFIDDDATAVRGWLESALKGFGENDPRPAWVGGPIDLEWETLSPPWIDAELRVSLGEIDLGTEARFLKSGERLGGGNSFYRRRILEETGGFDVRLGRRKDLLLSADETALQHRVQDSGGLLFYHPGVRIHHFVPRERTLPSYFYSRYYWGGRSDRTMGDILAGMTYRNLELEEQRSSRLVRLGRNMFAAVNPFGSRGGRIRARVYLSYVAGWIAQSLSGRETE